MKQKKRDRRIVQSAIGQLQDGRGVQPVAGQLSGLPESLTRMRGERKAA